MTGADYIVVSKSVLGRLLEPPGPVPLSWTLCRSPVPERGHNTYELDAGLRQRQRLQGGGLEGAEVFHYDGESDSPAWTQRGSTWTRSISGIGGELAAIQESSSGTIFQLTNLHGNVVATASASLTATKLLATFRFDEFGNPVSGSAGRYGWLGGKLRRTELASGIIQMGARSYMPEIGRFLSPDPIPGGSANAYDYADQDPMNTYDLTGTRVRTSLHRRQLAAQAGGVRAALHYPHKSTHQPHTVNVTMEVSVGGDLEGEGWMEVSLFYSPTKSGPYQGKDTTGKVKIAGADFSRSIHANAVCQPGWYSAVGGYFFGFEPGTEPLYDSNVFKTSPRYISCK
jgi:RHS repeat-associated protein